MIRWTGPVRGGGQSGGRVWIARRGTTLVAVVTRLDTDTEFHPMYVEGGERYPLPSQPLLDDAKRYAELLAGERRSRVH